jgi:hypothetical protein
MRKFNQTDELLSRGFGHRPAPAAYGIVVIQAAVLLALLAGLSGCASTLGPPVAGGKMLSETPQPNQVAWRAVRFRLNWPENTQPDWNMDLLLAHRLIAPILQSHQNEILVWRFHRRAGRDGGGHQFSFLFYAPSQTAKQMMEEIRLNHLLEELERQGAVEKVLFDDPQRDDQPQIQDTSDPNWSPAVQKAWPYYIMGVSQMWLSLIEEHAQSLAKEAPEAITGDLQAFYAKINEKMTATWENEGRHAFLHHLNALFGYSAMKFYLRF